MTDLTLNSAKSQAKALRQALAVRGTAISHAQALELVAQQHGARDWNTLHARLARQGTQPELALGDFVTGAYLGQRFRGRIIALSGSLNHRHVEIKLDEPVDTVKFESFSSLRRQIKGTIDARGRSHRKMSDGIPQLVVEKGER